MNETDYLTAKRTVDDRALNRRVLDTFAERLQSDSDEELRILEIGAGTGTMAVRLTEWGLFPDTVTYRAVEQQPEHVSRARERVPKQLEAEGYTIENAQSSPDTFRASRGDQRIQFTFEEGNAFEIHDTVDVVIACAFLDIVALPDALSHIQTVLAPDGLLYAPITFDGFTGFVPSHPFDETIEQFYHQHMEQRPGGPNAGRRLLEHLPTTGGEIVAVGGSDWILRPVDGEYPADEQIVVEHVLSTIERSIFELELDSEHTRNVVKWVEKRKKQVKSESLHLLAHNLDILCRF